MENNTLYSVLVRPVITEKSAFQARSGNAYAFEVDSRSNKTQIKEAVEKMYDVKVKSVRTARVVGKPRRAGRTMTKTRSWKKAIVVLAGNDHIELF